MEERNWNTFTMPLLLQVQSWIRSLLLKLLSQCVIYYNLNYPIFAPVTFTLNISLVPGILDHLPHPSLGLFMLFTLTPLPCLLPTRPRKMFSDQCCLPGPHTILGRVGYLYLYCTTIVYSYLTLILHLLPED